MLVVEACALTTMSDHVMKIRLSVVSPVRARPIDMFW